MTWFVVLAHFWKQLLLVLVLTLGGGNCAELLRDAFPDILPFPGHQGSGAFSDLGAWHGFALPADADSAGGFEGPFVHGQWLPGHWLSPRSLVRFSPGGAASEDGASRLQAHFVPGALRQGYSLGTLKVDSQLVFVGPRTAAVRIHASNAGGGALAFTMAFDGVAHSTLQTTGSGVRSLFNAAQPDAIVEVLFDPVLGLKPQATGLTYRAAATPQVLHPAEEIVAYYTISLALNASEQIAAQRVSEAFFGAPDTYFRASEKLWENYLSSVVGSVGASGPSLHQRLVAKALSTLVLNWRGATGSRLLHDGCTPSITVFSNGFWAWDSWKQAAALSAFDAGLAAQQVLAMFDYQGRQVGEAYAGMIPDKIGMPPDVGENWGNTKPPLAAWAVSIVYASGKDSQFLRDMFPRLEAYHQWWYRWRDHDGNGLCEFGATGNNLQGMKWESGMDNAPRFDNTTLLMNMDQAWSADQESVDLNSFLYAEKLILAAMAARLENATKAAAYQREAGELREKIQQRFFDEDSGYFFDRQLGTSGAFLGPMACEGFAPLWSGVASPSQAARVRQHLLNRTKFRTKVPFPTVAADAAQFDGTTGYWRGPVWLDQAYFALRGLQRYGYESDAAELLSELLLSAEGLGAEDAAAPFTENYNPLTGHRQGSDWFGWSSAHLLMLLRSHPDQPSDLPPSLESDIAYV